MGLWARRAACSMRAVLGSALRMPKKAAGATKEAKDKVKAAGPVLETCKPGDTINGINYLKTGKDPVIMADSEYPEWLFKLLEPRPTLQELESKMEKDGAKAMTLLELKRLVKLTNRDRIKEGNKLTRKE